MHEQGFSQLTYTGISVDDEGYESVDNDYDRADGLFGGYTSKSPNYQFERQMERALNGEGIQSIYADEYKKRLADLEEKFSSWGTVDIRTCATADYYFFLIT